MDTDSKKTLIFDVDGTLAPHGMPMAQTVAAALCVLERRGHTVGFASGKPAAYLEGLARGIGLERAVIIAENGAVIMTAGTEAALAERPAFFDRLHGEIARLFPGARLQHNRVNLTALAHGGTLEAVRTHLQQAGACDGKSCRFYLHSDSVELLPKGVDKGRAVCELKRLRGIGTADVIAAGNAENDVPMRSEAGLFLAVGDEINADKRFEDTEALMTHLLKMCR